MKKALLVCIAILMPVLAMANTTPAEMTGIHFGDIDGFYSFLISSSAFTILISTNNAFTGDNTTDWMIVSFSTNAYNILISTCNVLRDCTTTTPGNFHILQPGIPYSPKAILRNKPVLAILDKVNNHFNAIDTPVYLRLELLKLKYAQ